MNTLWVAILSFVGFIVAYHTYGRFLARKIFNLDPDAEVPSRQLRDDSDFVPTRREVVFGHHFTSIAGTGPIVGPAIAVFWGWLPALLWVVFGSIFIGAVHDLGSLVVSMRSRGQTIGDVAGRLISPRARVLFLITLFLALTVVIGIFGLVIAVIFAKYPQTVLSVWIEIPLAVAIGMIFLRGGRSPLGPSLGALGMLYLAVWIGVNWLPISFPDSVPLFGGTEVSFFEGLRSSVVIWTIILLVYCFIASVLPVQVLLQPRDYINSHQLISSLGLLALALVVARPEFAAPAINRSVPLDAPPIFPFLFITIACGAVSGFHCLVASGTSSKQIEKETDAQFVGYGSMVLEGALAVVVIIACCAGLGMGAHDGNGALIPGVTGEAAFQSYYGREWGKMTLVPTIRAFIDGAANLLTVIGLPFAFAVGIIAVMVASFAATTLDTATRLQRYVIQELAATVGVRPLTNKYAATAAAVLAGGALALIPGPSGPGSGGMILWPLFGAVNQLLAGLAVMVVAFYLSRHSKPVWVMALPCAMMIVLPAWAMIHQIVGWWKAGDWVLVGFGVGFEALQVWMLVEGALVWRRVRGVPPPAFPPLRAPALGGAAD